MRYGRLAMVLLCAAMPRVLVGGSAAGQPVVQAQPAAPTFGTRVEVLLLEVPVTDDRGRPVPDLERTDFVVHVGGEPQRVVAAEFVTDVLGEPRAHSTPAVSSNVGGDRRVLVIATDLAGDTSSAQRVLSRLADGLDDVPPSVAIGLSSLSSVAVRVTPGLDREVVKTALRNELRSSENSMHPGAGFREFDVSLGDSWRIVAGDRQLLQNVQARECVDAGTRESCGHELELSVRRTVEVARGRAETAAESTHRRRGGPCRAPGQEGPGAGDGRMACRPSGGRSPACGLWPWRPRPPTSRCTSWHRATARWRRPRRVAAHGPDRSMRGSACRLSSRSPLRPAARGCPTR